VIDPFQRKYLVHSKILGMGARKEKANLLYGDGQVAVRIVAELEQL
jgi:prepilin-type processing-associated H-X9-DG protein